jgi:hypothetical protein
LAQNDQITATIIQIGGLQTNATTTAVPAAVSGSSKTPQDSQSELVFFETLRDSVPRDLKERVVFEQSTQEGISDGSRLALAAVRKELDQISNKSGSIVVVGRRSSPNEPTSIDESIGSDTYRALGPVASAMVQLENKVFGSVLVLQAGVNTASIGDYHR